MRFLQQGYCCGTSADIGIKPTLYAFRAVKSPLFQGFPVMVGGQVEEDLDEAFGRLRNAHWNGISREQFVHQLTSLFPPIWQVHPFREGNTRTVVMMMTFFVEHHGYFMDQELMAASAGYVRDSFVMASLDQFSEFEHLERILLDAVCDEPIDYSEESLEEPAEVPEKYRKYQKEPYVPEPHYRREE